jgi:hypothetical protein
MTMLSSARDDALLKEIADYFEILASDSEAMAARGWSKRENTIRAKVWREAAADVRSIKIVEEEPANE